MTRWRRTVCAGLLNRRTIRSRRIRLSGETRGAWLGAEGVVKHSGKIEFDRVAFRISKLELERSEVRAAGTVEDALEVKSSLAAEVFPETAPAELEDASIRKFAAEPTRERELLIYADPGEKYTFEYGREWHIFWSDSRRSVLKRLNGGEVTAQLNLMPGSPLSKNQMPNAERFREEVKNALGNRFARFADPGEFVEFKEGLGRILRVVVEGRQGDDVIVWIYYLIVSPRGEQLVSMFTLREPSIKEFGDLDLRIIGSIRWTNR